MIRRRPSIVLLIAGCLAACGGGGASSPDGGEAQQLSACADGSRNGAETAVDCGGGACPSCAARLGCAGPADCASGVCEDSTCRAPACDDAARNGGETDVDCGGGCQGCDGGASCLADADCLSGACVSGTCAAPGGAPAQGAVITIGNLVETAILVKASASDESPETFEYGYARLHMNDDVATQLKRAGVAPIARETLDQALAMGVSAPAADILSGALPSPAGFIYFTWRGRAYLQYPLTVIPYDPGGAVEALLGVAASSESDTLTPVALPDLALRAQGSAAPVRVARYEGAGWIVASAGDLLSPPANVTALGDVGGTVRLGWTNPTGARLDHVRVYRSTAPGSLGERVTSTASASVATLEDGGLSPGTTYFYTVHAVDSSGVETANTNQVAATPLP